MATRLAAQQMGTLAGMSRKVRLLHSMHNVHSRVDQCSHLPRLLLPCPNTITLFARFKVGGQMPLAAAAWHAIATHLPSPNSLDDHPRQTWDCKLWLEVHDCEEVLGTTCWEDS